jgi:hypothetical protein
VSFDAYCIKASFHFSFNAKDGPTGQMKLSY